MFLYKIVKKSPNKSTKKTIRLFLKQMLTYKIIKSSYSPFRMNHFFKLFIVTYFPQNLCQFVNTLSFYVYYLSLCIVYINFSIFSLFIYSYADIYFIYINI